MPSSPEAAPGKPGSTILSGILLAFLILFSSLFAPAVQAQPDIQTTPEASQVFIHFIHPILRSQDSTEASNQLLSLQPAANPVAKQARPTRAPRPTATPPVIPPPSDPTTTNLMILFAILVVAVVILGVWINRRRVF